MKKTIMENNIISLNHEDYISSLLVDGESPINEAIKFAALKHGDQKRKEKNTLYILLPLKVYNILKENNCPETVLIAGLLHDTLEDTDTTPEEILNKFGEDVKKTS